MLVIGLISALFMPEPITPINNCQLKLAIAIVTLMLLLAGCREFLPYRTAKPEISGVLLQNGLALPNIAISSCVLGNIAQPCHSYKRTTTDSQGKFYFESVYELVNRASQIGDSSVTYNINFHYQGREFYWNGSGGSLPENVNLRCDISHQQLCTVHQFNP